MAIRDITTPAGLEPPTPDDVIELEDSWVVRVVDVATTWADSVVDALVKVAPIG
jgi:hypothetical protein